MLGTHERAGRWPELRCGCTALALSRPGGRFARRAASPCLLSCTSVFCGPSWSHWCHGLESCSPMLGT
eukprot:1682142-Alexandrium_andersonii.AAC.1